MTFQKPVTEIPMTLIRRFPTSEHMVVEAWIGGERAGILALRADTWARLQGPDTALVVYADVEEVAWDAK